jgi:hypothetical protein
VFCQSAAREKEIEEEFGNNSRTSPLATSKRLDSGHIVFVHFIKVIVDTMTGDTMTEEQNDRNKVTGDKVIKEKV